MQHSISAQAHGPLTPAMTRAVEACVHCGFCLAACPTYRELGQEMDSPRGRIVLMKQVLEGSLRPEEAQPHVDRCLGCLACEPACPSGVPYRDLISPFRAELRHQEHRPMGERLRRWVVSQTLPYPHRLRLAVRAGRWAQAVRALVPGGLRPMLDLLPPAEPSPAMPWPEVTPAAGVRRARVALLTGCAQDVFAPGITAAALAVFSRQGVEVVIPRAQGCCGGLAWHTGDLAAAQAFARCNLAAFTGDFDALITTAAGCGSALHEYHRILAGTPDAEAAAALGSRTLDASEFLLRLGLREPPGGAARPLRLAYHDACHLAHAQGVRETPRRLLRAIANVELCEIADSHLCCGSAGTYNLDQPVLAGALGRAKARSVLDTGAEMVATGNIGCLLQLRAHLATGSPPVRVVHTLEVLDAAARGGLP